jgi:hypothetical protein
MRSFVLTLFFIVQLNNSWGQTSGNIQLTNNGVAPVPIFALGRPAILSTAFIRKGKFYFNPEFNLGLDAKPWTIISRAGYYIVENKKATINLATNLNWFFMQRNPALHNGEEFQLQRYTTFELNGDYNVNEHQKIYYSYWRSQRLDKLGVWYENFVNLAYAFENIPIGSNDIISFKPSIFYLDDYGWLKGFFVAQTTNYQRKNWKCNLFLTTSAPITPHMPGTEFIWNTGVNIPF